MLTKILLTLSLVTGIGTIAVANSDKYDAQQVNEIDSTSSKIVTQSPLPELENIAKAITVKVYAGEDRGSGILIAQKNNTYTIITNAHVTDRGDTYTIETSDGIKHNAVISDRQGTENDLAILEFNSNNAYQVAKLGDSKAIAKDETVIAAGFPYDRDNLLITQGKISLLLDKPLAKGYEIGFSNKTVQGMSGGLLLNARGEAIGVLGKGKGALLDEAYNYQDGTTPTAEAIEQMKDSSFSVPIANIAELSPQLASLVPGNNPNVAQIPTKVASQPKLTGYPAEIDRIAEQITVRIDNTDNNSNGSGVIIAKQGNTYYGLTAKHVVCQEPISKPVCEPNGTHQIVTADGVTHQLDYQNVEANQAWLDMAIFSFESNNDYEVATIGKYRTTKDFHLVLVSGFPGQDKSSNAKPTRLITGGAVFPEKHEDFLVKESASLSKAQGIGQDGLLYTNISHRGMSGGAVLDAEGRLIGINTGSEQELYFDDKGDYAKFSIGFSLGESIIDLFGYLQANETKLQTAWLNVAEGSPPLPINAEIENAEIENAERLAQYFLLWQSTIEKPQNETDLAAWMNYGTLLQRQLTKQDEAIKAFEKVIAIDPNFDKAYYAIARTYLLTGKWQQIANIMTQATQINPNPYYYWRLLGRAYHGTEQYDRSLVAYEEAIAKNQSEGGKDFTLYVERAGVLAKSKQYDRALTAYEQAIKTNPNHPSAYNNRCHVYSLLEQYEKAIADCRKVTEINSQNDDAYFKLASIYRSLKEYDRVITVSSKALEINPQRDDIYVARGNAYLRLQKYEKAIADNDKAIEINPQNYNAYNVRGIANENLKKYDKAIADYGKAIDINSKNDVIYANRGKVYFKLEQYEQAIADYSRAIEINPQSALFYNNRGSAYHSLKQYEQAASDYNSARKIDPKSYVALKNLSLIDYEKNGTIQPQILLAASTTAIGNSVDLTKGISVGLNKLAEITLIIALHEQASGNTEKSLQVAKTALQTAPKLKETQFLRENLWGDKAIADVEKLFAQL